MNAIETIHESNAPAVRTEARAGGAVGLWLWNLDAGGPLTDAHFDLLSDDERRRARRLQWPMLTRWFVLGRCRVRETLGRLLNLAPAAVRFVTGPQGKPHVEDASAPRSLGLRFNWSHSGQAMLLGVSRAGEIGVDIELVRPLPGLPELAAMWLPRATRENLHALPEAERLVEFYRAWTRREAVAKAIGVGLTDAAEDVDCDEEGLKIFPIETGCGGVPVVGAVAVLGGTDRNPGWLG
ncbi:MAG TPA: 4'-phosphopantetheinyl transferase superfamily protein [Verrucomicrobiae bacterium]|jgi:4'-phosphopantetheinyl transferase